MNQADQTESAQLKKIYLEVDRLIKTESYESAAALMLHLVERLLNCYENILRNTEEKTPFEDATLSDRLPRLQEDKKEITRLMARYHSSSVASGMEKNDLLSLHHIFARLDEYITLSKVASDASLKLAEIGALLEERLKRIQSTFQSATILSDNGDIRSSAILLVDLFNQLQRVIDYVQQTSPQNDTYMKMVLSNFLPHWNEDRTFAQSLLSEEKSADIKAEDKRTTEAFFAVFSRMNQSVRLITQEISRMYPKRNELRVWLRKNRTILKKGALVVLVAILALYLGSYVLTRDHGLKGEYFSGESFSQLMKTRKDKTIDFNWGGRSPFSSLPNDQFSVRWTGRILIPEEGTYTFSSRGDDGVRLWIDGQMVIEDWNVHPTATNYGSLRLPKGAHDIKLEYFEQSGEAAVSLCWQREGEQKTDVIPARFFRKG